MDQIEAIVREVLTRLKGGGNPPPACDTLIPAELSARHVHLSQEDLRELFGLDKLECVRNISPPGQFLSGLLPQRLVKLPLRSSNTLRRAFESNCF